MCQSNVLLELQQKDSGPVPLPPDEQLGLMQEKKSKAILNLPITVDLLLQSNGLLKKSNLIEA